MVVVLCAGGMGKVVGMAGGTTATIIGTMLRFMINLAGTLPKAVAATFMKPVQSAQGALWTGFMNVAAF